MTVRDLTEVRPVSPGSFCNPLGGIPPVFFEKREGIHGGTLAKRYPFVNSNLHIHSFALAVADLCMVASEVRRLNLLALEKKYKTLERVAELTESNPAHLSQIKNKNKDRKMGSAVARRFEKKLGLPEGWMDHEHHDAVQGQLQTGTLLQDFEALPPLLQEYISRKARELRKLIDGIKPEYRLLISSPPQDPEFYREWERGILALFEELKQKV